MNRAKETLSPDGASRRNFAKRLAAAFAARATVAGAIGSALSACAAEDTTSGNTIQIGHARQSPLCETVELPPSCSDPDVEAVAEHARDLLCDVEGILGDPNSVPVTLTNEGNPGHMFKGEAAEMSALMQDGPITADVAQCVQIAEDSPISAGNVACKVQPLSETGGIPVGPLSGGDTVSATPEAVLRFGNLSVLGPDGTDAMVRPIQDTKFGDFRKAPGCGSAAITFTARLKKAMLRLIKRYPPQT